MSKVNENGKFWKALSKYGSGTQEKRLVKVEI